MSAIGLLLPSVTNLGVSLLVSALLLGLWWVLGGLAFSLLGMWIGLVEPTTGMLLAVLGGTIANYLTEGRERRAIKHAFQHYLAPAVVAELMHDPTKLRLGGERREITAFFSDIAGFTSIAEQLEPTVLVTLMNECLSELSAILLEEVGTIDKYVGDAIVAMFGAPFDQPDHAVRACRAALRCQVRMEELRAEWAQEGLPELRTRIGLNSGTCLVGNMGSRQRFDYTMLGDVVNLAARLEGAGKAYRSELLVGEGTRRLAGDAILMRHLDAVRVKGKLEPVDVYAPYAVAGQSTVDADHIAARYADALASYRCRSFEDAAAALMDVLALDPDDGPSQVLMARIEWFEEHPPPADWDGVFEMTTK